MEISIIGASGYTGIELMRILANHKKVDLVKPYSRTYAGKKADVVNKSLVKFAQFENFHDFDGEKTIHDIDSDVCFLSYRKVRFISSSHQDTGTQSDRY